MAERRNEQATQRKPKADTGMRPPAWEYLVFYLMLVVGCVVVMVTVDDFRSEGFIGLIVVLALAPIGLRGGTAEAGAEFDAMADQIHELSDAVHEMVNEGGLSENAKRVIHRRQERDLLCKAIEQDIRDQDWEAAMILVKELAERFGYRREAEQFRARIEQGRAANYDTAVTEAIQRLDALISEHDWIRASEEAARIARLYPDSPRVQSLPKRVDDAHRRYKLDLERRFLQAAQREETELAMSLLKELDQYLTEEEAAQFREVARGVIGKARDNLGVRFKLAIQDKDWPAALEVGEQIIDEFPNSRMAQEVREMIDVLRERSAERRGSANV